MNGPLVVLEFATHDLAGENPVAPPAHGRSFGPGRVPHQGQEAIRRVRKWLSRLLRLPQRVQYVAGDEAPMDARVQLPVPHDVEGQRTAVHEGGHPDR